MVAAKRTQCIDDRIEVLTRFWREFDVIHAHQRTGMKPLWGLLQEDPTLTPPHLQSPYQDGLHRVLLSTDLQQKATRLWGTGTTLHRPELIIPNPYPVHTLAKTFGVALQFWQGCGLT